MAAASYQHQQQYYNHCPLKILNRDDNDYTRYKFQTIAKRKSAVELLQETKPLYVKSETVLDQKQELRRSLRDYQPLPNPQDELSLNSCGGGICESIPLPKSPRLIPPPPAFRKSTCSLQLQNKLRQLINTNSKENLFETSSVSEDDSPRAAQNREEESVFDSNNDFESACIMETTMTDKYDRDSSINNLNCYKSLPDLTNMRDTLTSKDYPDQRSWNSPLCSASSDELCRKSINATVLSLVSCKNDYLQASNKSDESRNGTYSDNEEPDCVNIQEITSPVSPIKSCSSYITPPPLYWDASKFLRNQAVSRSKSDVGARSLSSPQYFDVSPYNSVVLNSFFDNLGLKSEEYSLITAPRSNASSPVYFDSSTSSVDSVGAGRSGNDNLPDNASFDLPSIVERNARIIKWLFNCRKACERIPVQSR